METGPATCRRVRAQINGNGQSREFVMHRVFALLCCCVVLTSVAANAADPPGRVARLNYMTGQVSLQAGGVNDWGAATINRPLTTADRVWTDRDSRAELQMGAASLRLN